MRRWKRVGLGASNFSSGAMPPPPYILRPISLPFTSSLFCVGLRERYVSPYNLALVFAGLGERETALQWLGAALEERDVHMPFLLDPKWDGMRGDGRFREIVSRAGFGGGES